MLLMVEYCAYGSLHTFLRPENAAVHGIPITMSLLYRFAVDVARGVQYLHRLGVIQRDIKARNVLVHESLQCKLSDFGLARVVEDPREEAALTACGTPAWTAPEVVKLRPYSCKVDVYAFGILMWELFARREPYAGQRGVQIAYAAAEHGMRPAVPPHCPPAYGQLMQECWAGDPAARPTIDEILRRLQQQKAQADADAFTVLSAGVAASALTVPPLAVNGCDVSYENGGGAAAASGRHGGPPAPAAMEDRSSSEPPDTVAAGSARGADGPVYGTSRGEERGGRRAGPGAMQSTALADHTALVLPPTPQARTEEQHRGGPQAAVASP